MTSTSVQFSENVSGCPAIDQLIESSKTLNNGEIISNGNLEWISSSDFTEIEPIQHFTGLKIRYAKYNGRPAVVLLFLGTSDKCKHEFINEVARIYSLPTHKYRNAPNIEQFKRYSVLLSLRNTMAMKGFTFYEDNYYLVAYKGLQQLFSTWGFCSACGILRCSHVWCICGHKELSYGWSSGNKKLDAFIRKTQRQTKTANDSHLLWLPFSWLGYKSSFEFVNTNKGDPRRYSVARFRCSPLCYYNEFIPLETSDLEDDLFYHKVIVQTNLQTIYAVNCVVSVGLLL